MRPFNKMPYQFRDAQFLTRLHRDVQTQVQKGTLLKTKLIAILVWTTLTISQLSFAEVPRKVKNVPAPQLTATSEASTSESLATVLSIPSPTPRGPKDLLQDYESGMLAVAQGFSGKLVAIAEAVQRGELSREQGEEISGEQYQLAEMQFGLLSTLRELLAQDLARTAAAPPAAAKETEGNEAVLVEVPLSPLQLNSELIQYLDLTPTQVTSIQELVSQERRTLEPLMAQLQLTNEQLAAITGHDQTKNENEIKSLANVQARNLANLLVANSRLRAKIYQLLSPQQQRRLDEFRRSTEALANN
jgi:Spy/CpxP family protein refolding chaperone